MTELTVSLATKPTKKSLETYKKPLVMPPGAVTPIEALKWV
jgi:hypothetical protein